MDDHGATAVAFFARPCLIVRGLYLADERLQKLRAIGQQRLAQPFLEPLRIPRLCRLYSLESDFEEGLGFLIFFREGFGPEFFFEGSKGPLRSVRISVSSANSSASFENC